MALLYIDDSDPWLKEYDACEKLFREIMEQLTLRNKHPKVSQVYASLSANVRIHLKQYNREVQQLKGKVDEALRSGTITIEEAERRTRQIEILQSRDIQLKQLYDTHSNDFASSRASLLTSGASAFADGGTTSWAADDDDNDDDDKPINVHVSVADLVTHQNRILQEQDKGLEELCVVIARQKEIGQTISNEVDHQNGNSEFILLAVGTFHANLDRFRKIISNLGDHMDRTDESLVNKTRQVQTISTKDRTCGYWIVIILLFISIVIVSLV